MKIVMKHAMTVMFGDLKNGDVFREENDDTLMMKTETTLPVQFLRENADAPVRNAVAIEKGTMLYYEDGDMVIRESGVFVRGGYQQ